MILSMAGSAHNRPRVSDVDITPCRKIFCAEQEKFPSKNS